jgi:hypothetical protein
VRCGVAGGAVWGGRGCGVGWRRVACGRRPARTHAARTRPEPATPASRASSAGGARCCPVGRARGGACLLGLGLELELRLRHTPCSAGRASACSPLPVPPAPGPTPPCCHGDHGAPARALTLVPCGRPRPARAAGRLGCEPGGRYGLGGAAAGKGAERRTGRGGRKTRALPPSGERRSQRGWVGGWVGGGVPHNPDTPWRGVG